MPRLAILTLLLICGLSPAAQAKIYVYVAPDGSRLVSDHPMPPGDGYKLVTRRDTVHDAGYLLAGRRPPPRGTLADYLAYIRAASKRYSVDPSLVEAVIHVESGFDPRAISNQGASGLMQLMWKTAQRYNVKDRFDPRENIFAGVEHLSELMKRFNGKLPLVLAAWNAGSGAVKRYGGVPPYPETQRFVMKVLRYQQQIQALYSVR